ncbi:hypothetical protein E2C01_057694 [Portunus trituberculatus]|uniref:Uncharacterized protein n=1 Tax=Portunus trituberculatus TaxID=210409 RepID=A0A5B7H1V0_PORTR|nr:hypothetical protein [Portunus trituberculatus]
MPKIRRTCAEASEVARLVASVACWPCSTRVGPSATEALRAGPSRATCTDIVATSAMMAARDPPRITHTPSGQPAGEPGPPVSPQYTE